MKNYPLTSLAVAIALATTAVLQEFDVMQDQ